ncbi:kinase-like protein [Auricularia subglabra TFB-10046 SS5]|nr:kinase-like protein [Auricularia subglabra TFB-10046 SS5]
MAEIGLHLGSIIIATSFDGVTKFKVKISSGDAIGSGGSAFVLKGETRRPAGVSLLALKVFPPSVDYSGRLQRVRELQAAAELGQHHHPHIASFVGALLYRERHLIILSPFMRNGNLLEYLNRTDAPRQPLIIQVADAVEYLHDVCGTVHGDLKCQNVLVSDEGKAVLTDFGLSTLIAPAHEPTLAEIRGMYTVRFAAPELLGDSARSPDGRTRSKTPQTDVYAFGMLMIEVLPSSKRPMIPP